jgi:monoamine oxidase
MRTLLLGRLRRAAAASLRSKNGVDGPRRPDWRPMLSRRQLLKLGAGGAAFWALGCGGATPALGRPDKTARVAVVGAGLAGLHCAYRLQQNRVQADIYEATSRVGGRLLTARGQFPDGMVTELGGEFIDSSHLTLQALASELGLALDDVQNERERDGLGELLYFRGRVVSEPEIVDLFRPVAAHMAKDMSAAEADRRQLARLDQQSISQWLATAGADPLLVEVLSTAYTAEYGLEASEQSALNLLTLIDYEQLTPFHIIGDSDERYRVRGGNDAITTALAKRLGSQIQTACALERIHELSDGRYRLTLAKDAGRVEQTYDHVVLAVPFSTLRRVDLATSGLSERKRQLIASLGFGTNAKLIGGFTGRPWRERKAFSAIDDGLQWLWDSTQQPAGNAGILTQFAGGRRGLTMGAGAAETQWQRTVPRIDEIFPGGAAAYVAGSAKRMHWPTAPYALGSYSCYRPGQAHRAGEEGQREGNLYFCGEHTSTEAQGYMEGACESGARVAGELLDQLTGATSRAAAVR